MSRPPDAPEQAPGVLASTPRVPAPLRGLIDDIRVWSIPMRTRFRGITVREGMLLHGPGGWAEWSPFTEYPDTEAATWLRASLEAATTDWPTPTRERVGVNVTVPVLGADEASRLVLDAGCRTAKVKVADPRSTLAADLDRVAAVRDALGEQGRLRVDANGAWSVDQAVDALRALSRYRLEYAEQPCASVEELAELRRRLAAEGIDVLVAADESIRRSGDPERVVAMQAADVAVLKVQPLGGMRATQRLASKLGLPVVISSALETSVGMAPSLFLAASLPELAHDCGLNTVRLLTDDLVADPLIARDGRLTVRRPAVDPDALARHQAPIDREAWWLARLDRVVRVVAEAGPGAATGQRGEQQR